MTKSDKGATAGARGRSATPLTEAQRRARYLAQTGRTDDKLTRAQERRATKKSWRAIWSGGPKRGSS